MELVNVKETKKLFKKATGLDPRDVTGHLINYNWETLFNKSMASGKGFLITDRNGIDAKKNRSENGIYSPKYGTNWGDENVFADKYACDCRQTIGIQNEGEYCPHCHTMVTYKDADLEIVGWIKLETDCLIHPNLFFIVESLIGPNTFRSMIKSNLETNLKGKYIECDFEEINKSKDKNRYDGIGLVNFAIHFDEIIDFFVQKNKKKRPEYEFLKKERDKIFVRHIPIYSTFIRPVLVTKEKMSYHDINSVIESLNVKCWRLNNEKKNMILKDYYRTLEAAQGKLIDYYLGLRSTVVEKKGDIRNKCLGGRFNYTSRNVIIPLSGTKINQIQLPYLGFLELYKPELINLLMKMSNITMHEALEIWNRATQVFDKKVYQLMRFMIAKGNIYVGINRNPTIEYGSILTMQVVDVYPDIEDYCMAIPLNVLGLIAGDFDGDVLNIIAYKGKKIVNSAVLKFDPSLNMQVSRVDGEFNTRVSLIKDQTIALYYFSILGDEKYKDL